MSGRVAGHGRYRTGARRRWLAVAPGLLLAAAGCMQAPPSPSIGVAGDPERGRTLLRSHGCGTCHVVPGVRGANGRVGPPLGRIARRAYLGGVLPNSPDNMARWIRSPQAVDPLTAMPDMGIDAADAADITAYLYRLE